MGGQRREQKPVSLLGKGGGKNTERPGANYYCSWGGHGGAGGKSTVANLCTIRQDLRETRGGYFIRGGKRRTVEEDIKPDPTRR